MSDQSTTVLQGYLERAMSGDAAARQRLLELTRDCLMRRARGRAATVAAARGLRPRRVAVGRELTRCVVGEASGRFIE